MAKSQRDEFDPMFVAEKAARQIIEENGADAVVILWTSHAKRQTRFWRHQIGNALLCNSMIETTFEEQNASSSEEEEEEEEDS